MRKTRRRRFVFLESSFIEPIQHSIFELLEPEKRIHSTQSSTQNDDDKKWERNSCFQLFGTTRLSTLAPIVWAGERHRAKTEVREQKSNFSMRTLRLCALEWSGTFAVTIFENLISFSCNDARGNIKNYSRRLCRRKTETLIDFPPKTVSVFITFPRYANSSTATPSTRFINGISFKFDFRRTKEESGVVLRQ